MGSALANENGNLPSQIVTPIGVASAKPGDAITVTVNYDVSDNDAELTGLGLRIHYDSNTLIFDDFAQVLEEDNIGFTSSEMDYDDYDNNPLTDMYVTASWVSIFGTFPGVLPVTLVTMNFTVSQDADVESTIIGFSKTSNTAGYLFASESYNLPIIMASWDYDNNGVVDALTDGLLLMRYTFELLGEPLVINAIAADSPLTPAEVEANVIASTTSFADIDGSGDTDALTDALLLMRYLFLLRDDVLINSAIKSDAPRQTATEIEAYIESYMP
jgi:hypothetical protein